MKDELIIYDLQLFSEDEGTGASTVVANEGSNNQLATDTGADNSNDTTDRDAAFEAMISGEYKEQYEKRFEGAMSKRLKSRDTRIKQFEDRETKTRPMFDVLALKYGKSADDIDGIIEAVNADNSYYETYAQEHGVSLDQAKSLMDAERIIQNNKAQEDARLEEEARRNTFNEWVALGEKVSEQYPQFDFMVESQDENFRNYLVAFSQSGLLDNPVLAAYEQIHRDEIMATAMNIAYSQSQHEAAAKRTQRANRIVENGVSSQQASTMTHRNMANLSFEERNKINDAIKRGEHVTRDNFEQYL